MLRTYIEARQRHETTLMPHHYKGHTIDLIPSAEGFMWACQYIITKFNQTEIAGFPDGNTYDTREDAETAALLMH